MKIDWRISAIVAGAAFLLSVLVGAIGNVTFGALLFRALAAAAVFGAGAVGVGFVVDRYLPELKSPAETAEVPESGGAVDIVVEGNDDLMAESAPVMDDLGDDHPDGAAQEAVEIHDAELAEDDAVIEAEELDPADDGADDPDELPSVDSMSDSFQEVPLAEESIHEPQSGEDPSVMARAIRTVLKREE